MTKNKFSDLEVGQQYQDREGFYEFVKMRSDNIAIFAPVVFDGEDDICSHADYTKEIYRTKHELRFE